MIAMAWGCETHARQLGRRTLLYYDGEAASVLDAIKAADARHDHGHDKRAIARAIFLFLSVAIPIGFVGYAQHIRHTVGFNWLGALGANVTMLNRTISSSPFEVLTSRCAIYPSAAKYNNPGRCITIPSAARRPTDPLLRIREDQLGLSPLRALFCALRRASRSAVRC